jgi:ankyrin repeat protein
VVFQLETISAEVTDQAILDSLQCLPKDLPQTFDRLLRKIHERNTSASSLIRRIFKLVAASERPLRLEELREALSIEPGETVFNHHRVINDMRKCMGMCGSLLLIDEEDFTVHFAHHSVKQYLFATSTDPVTQQYHTDPVLADLTMGEICVTYLNLNVFDKQLLKTSDIMNRWTSDTRDFIIKETLSPRRRVNKLAVKILKGNRNSSFDMEKTLRQLASQTQAFGGELDKTHPFLAYATEHWLMHTGRFEEGKQVTYSLWLRLISGNVSTISLPWGAEPWSTWSRDYLQWLKMHKHRALLVLSYTRLFGSDLIKQPYDQEALMNPFNQLLSLPAEAGDQLDALSDIQPGPELRFQLLKLYILRVLHDMSLATGIHETVEAHDFCQMLFLACLDSGQTKIAAVLLSDRVADINAQTSGFTPLARQIEGGRTESVKFLLAQPGIVVRHPKKIGRDPLTHAIQCRRRDSLAELLKHPDIVVNDPWFNGLGRYTVPLWLAVELAWPEGVMTLLERQDIDLKTENRGHEVLMFAVTKGYHEVVKVLLQHRDIHPNQTDSEQNGLLHKAATLGLEKVAENLLRHPTIDVNASNSQGNTPLHAAIEQRQLGVVELLLRRPDIEVNLRNVMTLTPLHIAAISDQPDVAKLLLCRNDIEVNVRDARMQTPLHIAIEQIRPAIAELLLRRPDIDIDLRVANDKTLLYFAVQNKQEGVVELLLSSPSVDVNQVDELHRTPLHHAAAERGYLNITEMLLSRPDIALDAQDAEGDTPLHLAADEGNVRFVERLLRIDDEPSITAKKSEVLNIKNHAGQTALHRAACSGSVGVVKLLLQQPDLVVDAMDDRHNTALHLLVARNLVGHLSFQIAEMLLDLGKIDLNSLDKHGRTLLDLMRSSSGATKKQRAFAKLLRAHGARNAKELRIAPAISPPKDSPRASTPGQDDLEGSPLQPTQWSPAP